MSGFKDQLLEGFQSTIAFLRDTREAYEGAGRFAKMRIWIVGVLSADLIATVMFFAFVGGKEIDVEVWFEQSFPSNMLIVRNETDDPLEKVKLVLDGKWVLDAGSIAPGLRGFEVNREFRDRSGNAPEDSYRPHLLHIEADGDSMDIPVVQRKN